MRCLIVLEVNCEDGIFAHIGPFSTTETDKVGSFRRPRENRGVDWTIFAGRRTSGLGATAADDVITAEVLQGHGRDRCSALG